MPITYRIDSTLKTVFAAGTGSLTDADLFDYQREVWSRPDVRGFHELMDMSGVERIESPTTDRVRDLAKLSARMDAGVDSSKFAIVASEELAFGLGRMYQAYREMSEGSTKEVGVFRSMKDALAFLGLEPEEDRPKMG